MKARLTKLILSVFVITFTLTGCSKDEGIISSTASSKQDILTFATIDEFNETLQKVNSMKPEERIAWEKEQGFKSYGTICDEFYKTVNPESFKNIDEVKIFVKKNSDKIELYTSSDGEIYCITKYFKNPKRYLLNKDKQYKIGLTIMNDEIGRESNCDSASNSLGSQKVSSAVVTSDEIIQNSIYNGVSYNFV